MPDIRKSHRILVVDDDDSVRAALGRFLGKLGYQVEQANGGPAALALLGKVKFAAMLCDIRMPEVTGVDLLPQVLAADPDLAVIMLTAVGDPASAIQCLKVGAADYLIKPVELDELQHALQSALRRRELEVERREMEQWLAREVAEKTKELTEQSRQVELLSLSILTALVDAAEPAGSGGRNHSMRVANLSAHVAAELGLSGEPIELVRLAGRLHDLGKVVIGHEHLRRVSAASSPADIAASESNASLLGARILSPLHRHGDMVLAIRHQHERFDGGGSPDGLQGEAIPLGARIVAATNLYDELSEGTGTMPPMPPAEAKLQMDTEAGSLLDPAVVKALDAVLERRRR